MAQKFRQNTKVYYILQKDIVYVYMYVCGIHTALSCLNQVILKMFFLISLPLLSCFRCPSTTTRSYDPTPFPCPFPCYICELSLYFTLSKGSTLSETLIIISFVKCFSCVCVTTIQHKLPQTAKREKTFKDALFFFCICRKEVFSILIRFTMACDYSEQHTEFILSESIKGSPSSAQPAVQPLLSNAVSLNMIGLKSRCHYHHHLLLP